MKKLMTIFAFALVTAVIAPSCSSDETFEEVVESSQLDQSYTTDAGELEKSKPGEDYN